MAYSRHEHVARDINPAQPADAPDRGADLDLTASNASVVSVGRPAAPPGAARLDMSTSSALQPLQVDPLDPNGWRPDPSAVAERVVFRLWADGAVSGRSIEQARRELDGRTRLDQALVKLGVVDEEVAARALYAEIGARVAEAADFPDEPLSGVDLPPRFIRETLVAPLADDGAVLRVAMADPLDEYALRAIAMKTRRRLEILAAPPRLMRAYVDRLCGATAERPSRPSPKLVGAERPAARPAERAGRALPPPSAAEAAEAPARTAGRSRIDAAARAVARANAVDATAFEARSPREGGAGRPSKPSFVRPQRVTLRNRSNAFGAQDARPAARRDDGPARSGRALSARMRERSDVVDAARVAAVEVVQNWREPARAPLARDGAAPADLSRTELARSDLGAAIDLSPRDAERRGEAARRRRFVGGFVGGFIGAEPADWDRTDEAATPLTRQPATRSLPKPAAPMRDAAERVSARDARADAATRTPSNFDPLEPSSSERPLEARLNDISARLRERQIGAEATPRVEPVAATIEATPRVTRRDLRVAQRRSRHQRARELVMLEIRRSLRKEASRAPAIDAGVQMTADAWSLPPAATALGAAPVSAGSAAPNDTLRSPRHRPADPAVGQSVRHALAPPAPGSVEAAAGALAAASPDEQRTLAVLAELARGAGGLTVFVGGGDSIETMRRCAARLSSASPDRFDDVAARDSIRQGARSGCGPDGAPRIAIGFIGDAESAEAAARLAMTGGVVLAAIDAPSAAAAAPRLVEFGLPPYAIASSLRAIVTTVSGAGGLGEIVEPDDAFRALILSSAPEAAFGHALTSAAAAAAARRAAAAAGAAVGDRGGAAPRQAASAGRARPVGDDARRGGGQSMARRTVTAGPSR